MTLTKTLILSLPVAFFCSCGSSIPTSFATPEEALAAQTAAASATGLKASQLTALSPAQIQTLQSLPVDQLANLKNLKGAALATEVAKISAPSVSKFAAPTLPSLKTPTLPGLEGLSSFSGFTGGQLSKTQALELATATGLQSTQLKNLSVPEIAKLQALEAPQLAELKGLKGSAFDTKLASLEAPKTPWYKAPFVNTPAYTTIERGMTQEQVTAALGRPSYKYRIGTEETWVFENSNFVMDKIKSTALNMVPVAGPASTFAGSLRQSAAKSSKAAITFDASGKVIEGKQG